MKHINLIKRAKYITTVLLVVLTLFGCDNGTNESKKDKETTGIKVSGIINIDGAGPSLNVSRSATVSIPATITWIIEAETTDYVEGAPRATAYAYTTSNGFDITFATSGTWNISVTGYAGEYGDNNGDQKIDIPSGVFPAFSGSLPEVNISEDGSEEPLDISVYTNKTSGTGIVSLAISDTSGKLQKGTAVFTNKLGDFQPIIKEFTFTHGQTSVQESEVPAGYYTVDLTFEDRIGNVLYACKESVNVYEGLTTNTWYGSAPYLSDDAFVITQELLDAYGAEPVPSTNNVIYTAVSEGGVNTYNYYLIENITLDPELSNSIAETKLNYCFDADGYFYTFVYDLNSGYKVISSKYENALDIPAEINNLNGITIDRKTNVLYAWHGMGMIYDIYKFPNLISNGTTEYDSVSGGDYSHIDQWFDHSNTTLIINDGIMYAFTGGGAGSSLRNKKLYVVDTAETSPKAKQITLDYESAGLTESDIDFLEITDVIYQEGALYILAREVDAYKSRGALIKYDTFTGFIDVIGHSNDVKENTELADVNLKAYYKYDLNNVTYKKPLYTDESLSTPLTISSNTVFIDSDTSEECHICDSLNSLYTPSPLSDTLSETEFYGPVRFVAVKPKKLVIADDGIAFYTDLEGVLKYKNVNRIITVDLDSFSMEIENVRVSFNGDSSDLKTAFDPSTETGYQNALSAYISTDDTTYYESGQLTDASKAILCIPCGD